jgi:hypothetical protein
MKRADASVLSLVSNVRSTTRVAAVTSLYMRALSAFHIPISYRFWTGAFPLSSTGGEGRGKEATELNTIAN